MKILIIIMLLGLSACSTHKMNFDCKAQSGMGCKSVSDVNETLDIQGLGQRVSTSSDFVITIDQQDRIWFAPFIDEYDNYHSSQYVYVAIK